MTIADLAGHLSRQADAKIRWKYVWEFLEEYRWEPAERKPGLLQGEPPPTGDEQWDAPLAALAEHLAAQLDQAPPAWSRSRVLATPWFFAMKAFAARSRDRTTYALSQRSSASVRSMRR